MTPRASWLTPLPTRGPVRAQLLCLPHAGGGAAGYRPWARAMPEGVQVVLVNLPGRESRFGEPAARTTADVARPLAQAIAEGITRPYAFFGHSMGSLLAYETAHALRAQDAPQPIALFVSAHRGPAVPHPRPGLHLLTEPDLLAHLHELGGMPREVLEHRELLDLVLPVLRADLALCDAYRREERLPFDVPIVAYGGEDDATVAKKELDEWARETTRGYRSRLFPGDHFYLSAWGEVVLSDVAAEMGRRMNGG